MTTCGDKNIRRIILLIDKLSTTNTINVTPPMICIKNQLFALINCWYFLLSICVDICCVDICAKCFCPFNRIHDYICTAPLIPRIFIKFGITVIGWASCPIRMDGCFISGILPTENTGRNRFLFPRRCSYLPILFHSVALNQYIPFS
jgi:hypothetical protein